MPSTQSTCEVRLCSALDCRKILDLDAGLFRQVRFVATCIRSETEQAAGVVANAPPKERVGSVLKDWGAETQSRREAVLDVPTGFRFQATQPR